MIKINKDTLIAEALSDGNVEEVAKVLKSYGMHCFGCAMAHGESLEDAASAHGVNIEEMIEAVENAANS